MKAERKFFDNVRGPRRRDGMTKEIKAKRDFYWVKDDGKNKKLLEKMYPASSREELEKAFPERNWQAIKRVANNFGFKRVAQDGWNEELDRILRKAFEESQNPELSAKERSARKFKLHNRINQVAAKNNLRPKKWNAIYKHANELGLSWGARESVAEDTKKSGEAPKDPWDQDALFAYLSAKRTTRDLEKYFGEPTAAIELKLPKEIGNYELVSYRNTGGNKSYFYREKLFLNGKLPKPIWKLLPVEEDGEDPEQSGGIFLQFPDELDWRQIRILPLAEVHIGSPLHLEKKFSEYLALGKHPYHHFIINGSVFALPPKGRTESKIDYLHEISAEVIKKLRPVAHKILWAHQGCTEERIERDLNFDPLEEVCQKLGIPYFKRPVYSVILWKGHIFSFYSIHGTTTAKELGSMINPVVKLLNQFNFVNFVIMSHQKSGMDNVVPRCIRDRINARLILKNQHLIVTPSFVRYGGSREERKGQPPPARGSHAMILFPDGECATSS